MAAVEVSAVISGALGRLNGAIHSRDVCQLRQMVAAEEVLERSGISQSSRSHPQAYVLSEQAGGDAGRERRHVFAQGQSSPICSSNVRGVVKQALHLRHDLAKIELAVAAHARPLRSDDVRSPCGIAQRAVLERIDRDTTVDHRDQVCVRQRVEDCSGSRPVNAAEDEVVIKREQESVRFADGQIGYVDAGGRRRVLRAVGRAVRRWTDRIRRCGGSWQSRPRLRHDGQHGSWAA